MLISHTELSSTQLTDKLHRILVGTNSNLSFNRNDWSGEEKEVAQQLEETYPNGVVFLNLTDQERLIAVTIFAPVGYSEYALVEVSPSSLCRRTLKENFDGRWVLLDEHEANHDSWPVVACEV